MYNILNEDGEVFVPAFKGDDGKSAYEIAVENGFVGTEQEWLDSLKGEGGGGSSYVPNTLIDPDKTYLVVRIPTDNDEFTLLTGDTGSPDYTIEWGDGFSDSVTDTSNPTHTYEKAGMYLITISGDFANGIVVGGDGNVNKSKMIEVYGGGNYPTDINGHAFFECINLTEANFPNVTFVSDRAFRGCYNLTKVNFPNVTSISGYTFYGCSNLTEVNFPKAISIGIQAFQNCTNLTEVNFPNATSIGSSVFQNCTNLTTVNFPKAISVGQSAFSGCSNLTTATFPSTTNIGDTAFYGCSNLTEVNFPNVTSVGSNAFRQCTNLKTLTLGNLVTTGVGTTFTNVVLDSLTISGNITEADATRIKTFFTDNGGTFSNSYEISNTTRVTS